MASAPEALLRVKGITKAFGHTQALAGAEFELRAGEIHALCGANGAGKSTLSRIIAGQITCDAGEILYQGEPVHFASARDALRAGISVVMQETSLCPDLSVLENIYLPELGTSGRLSWRTLRRQATDLLYELDRARHIQLHDLVSDLPIGTRQLIEIAKALALNSEVIIFDEPTASFSPQEVENLFDVLRLLARRGKGLVFVSHRLEEIFALADRVTVLRDGCTVANGHAVASLASGDLIRLMVGRELTDIYAHQMVSTTVSQPSARAVLEVRHLRSAPAVRDVSFVVQAGEILGLGGLVGAGRSEAVESIFGLRPRDSGEILLNGEPVELTTATDAVAAGIGFIGEDRRRQGIAPDITVEENLMLAHLGQYRGLGRGYRKHSAAVAKLLESLGLPDRRILRAGILDLSGGQQQKVILARWLLLKPKVLILDEPTRGVDIGTRSSIYEILRRIAADGMAVIVVSSDFEEILGLCDRIVIVSDGATVTDIPAGYLDVEKLTMFAAPRTSAEATQTLLKRLTDHFGGMAYWVNVDADRAYCFDSVSGDNRVETGLTRGRFPLISETRIPTVLTRSAGDFITDDPLASVLMPLRSQRGHDLGFVGLSVARTRQPTVAAVTALIDAWKAEVGLGSASTAT